MTTAAWWGKLVIRLSRLLIKLPRSFAVGAAWVLVILLKPMCRLCLTRQQRMEANTVLDEELDRLKRDAVWRESTGHSAPERKEHEYVIDG